MDDQVAASPAVKSRFAALLSTSLVVGAFGMLGCGCMLTNINADECDSTAACVTAFGLGSDCVDGYCTEPAQCQTGHDCRASFNGGVCDSGICRNSLPEQGCAMQQFEPAALNTMALSGPDAVLLIGAVLSLDDVWDLAQGDAARLAVREINGNGGMVNGRKLGIVLCDNGGPGNAADGTEREGLNRAALDYLSGTLGVPALVGPFSSTDSMSLINHALSRSYPTVIVSPSATSPQLTLQTDRLNDGDPHGLLWRTCSSDHLQGQVLANDVIGAGEHVAVVYIQDPYGQGLATVFQDSYEDEPSNSTTALFPFDADTDLTALAADIAAASPTSVLLASVVATDTVDVLVAMAGEPTLTGLPYYFTDGSKDSSRLLDPTLDPAVQAMIQNGKGTGPAKCLPPVPSSPNDSPSHYDQFDAALNKDFSISANDYGFLANTYDAAYVVGYGVLHASAGGPSYDGRNVAAGLASLSLGSQLFVGAATWADAKTLLTTGEQQIDIEGTSGLLDFDEQTGEAPGPIEIWYVLPGLAGFETEQVVLPTGL